MGRLLLVALVLLLAVLSYRVVTDLEPRVRRRLGGWLLGLAVAIGLLFFFARFGLHWLALLGAAALALLRVLLKLTVRAWPWLAHWFRAHWSARVGSGFGPEPRDPGSGGANGAGQRTRGGMTREEALSVLGLEGNPTREQVLTAYKHLMKKVHPDSPGGSDYLAKQVNRAKDALLG